MKIIIISSSPNKIGLTNTCVKVCSDTLKKYNHEVEKICLNDFSIKRCEACGPRGWGVCLEKHCCRIVDDFASLQKKLNSSDAVILVSPVYFWEMSESAKTFF